VAHNNLGAAYFGNGKSALAIFHFVEALKIKPGYEAAHRNLNRAMGPRDDMETVITKMHHLLKIYPEITALHYNLGNLYRGSGQYEKALDQYRIALELQPEFVQALNNQAGTYIAVKNYDEGMRLLTGKSRIDVPLKKKEAPKVEETPKEKPLAVVPSNMVPLTTKCTVVEGGNTRCFLVTVESADSSGAPQNTAPAAASAAPAAAVRTPAAAPQPAAASAGLGLRRTSCVRSNLWAC